MSDIMVAMMGAEVPALKAETDLCLVDFKPQCITWCDFLTIFYFCSNTFKIKQYLSCCLLDFITFNRQIEESYDQELQDNLTHEEGQKCLAFNLCDTVICKWKNELAEVKHCNIDPCSLMRLNKALLRLQTLDNFEKLCNLKVEALTRSELVSTILRSIGDPDDERLILTVSVKLSPETGDLSPILFNFRYEIGDLQKYQKNQRLSYEELLCAKNCHKCPRVLCEDKCPCKPEPCTNPCCETPEPCPEPDSQPEPESDNVENDTTHA